jgi:uncharacterized membrane protein
MVEEGFLNQKLLSASVYLFVFGLWFFIVTVVTLLAVELATFFPTSLNIVAAVSGILTTAIFVLLILITIARRSDRLTHLNRHYANKEVKS